MPKGISDLVRKGRAKGGITRSCLLFLDNKKMNDKQLMILTKVLGVSIFLLIGAFHYVLNGAKVAKKTKAA